VRRVDAVLESHGRRERDPSGWLLISYCVSKPARTRRSRWLNHVAVFGIVQEEGEVVEQAERVVGRIGVRGQAWPPSHSSCSRC